MYKHTHPHADAADKSNCMYKKPGVHMIEQVD